MGSKCENRVNFNRNRNLFDQVQVELGVAAKVFKDADHSLNRKSEEPTSYIGHNRIGLVRWVCLR